MPNQPPANVSQTEQPLRGRHLLFWARHGIIEYTRASAYRKFCRRNRGLRVTAMTRFGFSMELEVGDSVDNHILVDGEFEPLLSTIIKGLSPKSASFVDVGCNIGYFSCLYSRLSPAYGRCLSIDANPAMVERCQKNLQLNGFQQSACENIGVAADVGTMEFHVPENRHSLGSFGIVARARGPQRSFQVATKPLTDILSEHGISDVDILKIDIEGFEPQLFRGLDVGGKINVKNILFEYCPPNLTQCGFTPADIWNFSWWEMYSLFYLDTKGDVVMPFDDPASIPETADTVWAVRR